MWPIIPKARPLSVELHNFLESRERHSSVFTSHPSLTECKPCRSIPRAEDQILFQASIASAGKPSASVSASRARVASSRKLGMKHRLSPMLQLTPPLYVQFESARRSQLNARVTREQIRLYLLHSQPVRVVTSATQTNWSRRDPTQHLKN